MVTDEVELKWAPKVVVFERKVRPEVLTDSCLSLVVVPRGEACRGG